MAPMLHDEEEKAALDGLVYALTRVREVDPEMPAQTLYALLEIVKNPGMSSAELNTKLGMSSAGVSRVVSRLTEWKDTKVTPKVPGLDFITRTENLMDRRHKILEPTAKGLAFVRKLIKKL
jgi:DNA-binding MarR family transcriptional regulator